MVVSFHKAFQKAFSINCLYLYSLPCPSPRNPPNLVSLLSLYNAKFYFPFFGRSLPDPWSLMKYPTSVDILILIGTHISKA